ncbi:MAG: DUF3710 domain-containing protein [Candidatus Nanopelagicales bacterium]
MALFRRRSTTGGPPSADASPAELVEDPAEADAQAESSADPDEGGEPVAAEEALPRYDRSRGPYDDSESDRAEHDVVRLDLGALLIPGLAGVSIQVEADPSTQQVRAITGVLDDAAVQLQVFAAPRSEGLWDEIRAGMLTEIMGTEKAQVLEASGAFGPEIRAVLPARSPEGKQVMQPVRFVGIDGPRWFLRAVFLGKAAAEPDPEDVLHTLVRQTIVVRGTQAMAPQDPLPLRLPEQPAEAEAVEDDDATATGDEDGPDSGADRRYADLDPFERGPEITETR